MREQLLLPRLQRALLSLRVREILAGIARLGDGKRRLGAAALVEDARVVFVGIGSTTEQFAQYLPALGIETHVLAPDEPSVPLPLDREVDPFVPHRRVHPRSAYRNQTLHRIADVRARCAKLAG